MYYSEFSIVMFDQIIAIILIILRWVKNLSMQMYPAFQSVYVSVCLSA